MPNRKTVEDFVATVERGDYVGAIERFYAEDASMQENAAAPRIGRKTLADGEAAVMAGFDAIKAERLSGILIEGDEVAVRWRWSFTKDGKTNRFEEIAFQTWQGDKVQRETFFYDPAQMKG